MEIHKYEPNQSAIEELVYFTPARADTVFPYAIVAAGISAFRPAHPIVTKRYSHQTLIFTISGKGLVSLNGRKFEVTPATVTWLNTSVNYAHGCHPNSDEWTYIWFAMTGHGLDALQAETTDLASPVFHVAPNMEASFRQVLQHIGGLEPRKGIRSTVLVADVLAALLLGPADVDKATETTRVGTVLTQVRNDLAHKWSVAGMAELASTSAPHFHRLFKRELGVSPMEWLRNERLNAAKYMLARSNYRVAEIGRQCGYMDPYNFSRDFARTVGEPPSAFRKSAKTLFSQG